MDGFVFRRPRKEVHVERVRLRGHPVDCPCGTRWFAAVEAFNEKADDPRDHRFEDPLTQTCPDCGTRPQPGRIGKLEEVVEEIPLVFGAFHLFGNGTGTVTLR